MDGKSILLKNDYAKINHIYDECGNETEIAFFGINDEFVLTCSGFAKAKREYDMITVLPAKHMGQMVDLSCQQKVYAKIMRVFDERGNNTEIAYFGLNEEPVLHRRGYTQEINIFDVYGNIAETQYFDLDGSQVTPLSD